MPLSIANTITDSQKMGIKFIRRPDLNSSKRLHIATTALLAMLNNHWGTISGMAKQYNVSRTFIYMLASTLTEMILYFLEKQINMLNPNFWHFNICYH